MAAGRAEEVGPLLFLSVKFMISYRHNAALAPRLDVALPPVRQMPKSTGRPPSAGVSEKVIPCPVCGSIFFKGSAKSRTCGWDCLTTLRNRNKTL